MEKVREKAFILQLEKGKRKGKRKREKKKKKNKGSGSGRRLCADFLRKKQLSVLLL